MDLVEDELNRLVIGYHIPETVTSQQEELCLLGNWHRHDLGEDGMGEQRKEATEESTSASHETNFSPSVS